MNGQPDSLTVGPFGLLLFSAIALGLSGCATSQQEVEYARLPASSFAGLKAGLSCSAIFVAHRPLEKVLNQELQGMPAGAEMTGMPVVDMQEATVSVAYSSDRAPRRAVFRDGRGCTILPDGEKELAARDIPTPKINRAPARVDWPTESVATANMSLKAALDRAMDSTPYGKGTLTVGVVVVQHGVIKAERYREGFGPRTPYRMWSSAKMLTNALTGVSVQQGALNLDAPGAIPEWRDGGDPRSQITIRDLLHMSSGLDPKGSGAYPAYQDGADVARVTTSALLTAKPGARWTYANRDTLLLGHAIRSALGDVEYWRLPYEAILDPLGMADTIVESDAYGNYVMSSQVYSTPRDMARLGLLYLNDGVWDGKRLLPEGWVKMSTTPAPARARGIVAFAKYGLRGALGYGAQIWLYRRTPGLIHFDGYTAIGHRGQYITVIPERDLVIVRTGLDPEEGGETWRQDLLANDVIKALAQEGPKSGRSRSGTMRTLHTRPMRFEMREFQGF